MVSMPYLLLGGLGFMIYRSKTRRPDVLPRDLGVSESDPPKPTEGGVGQ